MTYWHETMHDDISLIMNEGWLETARPRKAIEDKDRKLAETPDLVVGSGKSATKYKMDLLPPDLIVAHYFKMEQERVTELEVAAVEELRAVEEFVEENATDEGLLSEAMEDGKVTKALTAARLKEAKREGSDPDEVKALEHLIDLYAKEAEAKKTAKEARASLDLAILGKYGTLTEAEIRQIVLMDKWLEAIISRVSSEVEALTLALVSRIQELGERYDNTVGDLRGEVEKIDARLATDLSAMGID